MTKEKKHPLEGIKFGVLPICNYRGVFVTKLPSGLYSLWGRVEISADEVDRIIDESLLSVGKSIKQ